MDQQVTVQPPVPASDRGFLTYAGGPIPTTRGTQITVRESSAALGPHVWLFVEEGDDPHLDLDQALALHAALGQFIDGVPERWEGGAQMLADARARVLGDVGTTTHT